MSYIFPFPLDDIPIVNWVAIPWHWFTTMLVACSSAYCFHVTPDSSHMTSGSGDQLIRWIELATYAVISIPTAIAWSLADRKRKNYSRLFAVLRLWSMLFVSSNMLGYGATKIFPSQFPPLHDYSLTENVGDMSPMGLLWTFMSASAPYTIFTGLVEATTGMLLAFPATMILGALLSTAVSLQIVMLNMCYDVPVKILSLHLLLLSVVILSPEIPALFRIFVLRAPPSQKLFAVPAAFKRGQLNKIFWLVIWVFLATHFISLLARSAKTVRETTRQTTASGDSLTGTWTVTSTHSDDHQVHVDQWQYVAISRSRKDWAAAGFKNGRTIWFKWKTSDDGKHADLSTAYPKWSMHCDIEKPDAEHLVLTSDSNGSKTFLNLQRSGQSEFPLLNRGFHWVNETPYNR